MPFWPATSSRIAWPWGWSQRALARRAGIRPETLCRIEAGTVTPTVASIERIDAALRGQVGPSMGKAKRRSPRQRSK
jgi:transcriptional regulator with XRE-family HTH domain